MTINRLILWSAFSTLCLSACANVTPNTAKQISPSPSSAIPGKTLSDASFTTSTSTFQSFPVYTDRKPRSTHYIPSGYMGDSDITMSGAFIDTPQGMQGPCLRVYYKAKGVKGWSGLYWQDPANNWGEVAGRAGYDIRGAQQLSFWARGENGGERIHEFRIGGIVGKYPDSDVANLSNIRLSKEWKKYTINLRGKDLRHIIGGFAFMVLKAENPGGATFFMDDIFYEGAEGPRPVTLSSGTVPSSVGQPTQPVPTPPVPVVVPVPVPPSKTKDMEIKETDAGIKVSFSSRLLFSSGKSVLTESSVRVMNQLTGLLTAYPTNRVLIEGHTDKSGDANFNIKLSELRAQSVRNVLIKQGGFDESRFEVIGYGATRPIADNSTAAGRLLNRRVEVTILKDVKK